MDEQVQGGGAAPTAPVAPAPASPSEAPAAAPEALSDVRLPDTAGVTATPAASSPAAPGAAPSPAPPPSVAAPPVWQQQLAYVEQLGQALALQEASEQAALREFASMPGMSPEQVDAMAARYGAKAAERLQAQQGLQLAREQLQLSAARDALEGPTREVILHQLVVGAEQVAPGIDGKAMRGFLERMPSGEAMVESAKWYVEQHRNGTLAHRAATGTDTMGASASAAEPSTDHLDGMGLLTLWAEQSHKKHARR